MTIDEVLDIAAGLCAGGNILLTKGDVLELARAIESRVRAEERELCAKACEAIGPQKYPEKLIAEWKGRAERAERERDDYKNSFHLRTAQVVDLRADRDALRALVRETQCWLARDEDLNARIDRALGEP